MKDRKIHVNSFEVDHTTLKAGLYLRENRWIGPFSRIKVWDLRFVAPMDKKPLPMGALHVIEHIFAYKLREKLGSDYISVFVYGCKTGFGFISKGRLTEEGLKQALIDTIDEVSPIKSVHDVPAMNEKQCGSPFINNVRAATIALNLYFQVLTNAYKES